MGWRLDPPTSKVYGRKPGGMGRLTVVMRRAGLGGYNRFLVRWKWSLPFKGKLPPVVEADRGSSKQLSFLRAKEFS